MRNATPLVLLVAALGLLGAGEQSPASEPPAEQPAKPTSPEEAALERRSRLQRERARPLPEAAPPEEEQWAGAEAELPDALREAVIADAAAKAGVDPAAVSIKAARAVTWPDGSLGCPQPNTLYTQMLVPGYRILVQARDQAYDYRATQKGTFQICESRHGVHHATPPADPTR